MELFVSCNTKEKGTGSFEKPFGTIEEARDYIRCANGKEFTVNIMGGRYFIHDTVRFDEKDKPTVYRAFDGEKVIFDGGVILDNSKLSKITDDSLKERIIEKDARDKIYEIDLSEYGFEPAEYGVRGFRRMHRPSSNELFINGEAQRVSEYPKNDKAIPIKPIEGGNDTIIKGDFNLRKPVISYSDDRILLWKNAYDAYMSGTLAAGFTDAVIGIEKIDIQNRTLTLEINALFEIKENPEHRWKIINLLEELSEEGEYYIDRQSKKLYFYHCEKTDIQSATLQISVLDKPMLPFIDAKNIKIQGITFENSRGIGVYIGGETSVANNVFIDCYPGPDPNTYDNNYSETHTTELKRRRVETKDENDITGVDVTSDIWREKYPYMYETYVNDFLQETRNYNNFVCCGQYQNFVDENPSNLNFNFRKDSYMLTKWARVHDVIKGYDGKEKIWFKDIDFDSIGLVDEERKLIV